MTAIFLQGNALSVLKGLPPDFIHCVTTSPPYFGLRKYQGGEEIWDGDEKCEHIWSDSSTPRTGGIGDYEVGRVGNAKARVASHESRKSDTCSKCDAWKGQLGAEPTPSLYLAHLIQIMREVRRVLRPDGVFWLNIGSSYSSVNTDITDGLYAFDKESSLAFRVPVTLGIASHSLNVSFNNKFSPDDILFSLFGVKRVVIKQRDNHFSQVFNVLAMPCYLRISKGLSPSLNMVDDTDLNVVFDEVDSVSIVVSQGNSYGEAQVSSVGSIVSATPNSEIPRHTSFPVEETCEPVPEIVGDIESDGQSVLSDFSPERFPDIYFVDKSVPLPERLRVNSSHASNLHVTKATREEFAFRSHNSRVNFSAIFVSQPYLLSSDGIIPYDIIHEHAIQVKSSRVPLQDLSIPERLKLAAQDDGWICRSTLIWAKGVSCSDEYNGNPMPESVNGWRFERCRVKVKKAVEDWRVEGRKRDGVVENATNHVSGGNTGFMHSPEWIDCPGCPKCEKHGGYVLRKGSWRPTDSYEHILMLTKTSSYFCDREAVLEPIAQSTIGRGKVSFGGEKGRNYSPDENDPNFRNGSEQWGREYDYQKSNGNGGRNLRSVLLVPTMPFRGAHFAVFSPKLIEPLIKAATSEKGCCPVCGSPWARVIDKGFTAHDGDTATEYAEGTNANRLALLRQAARQRGSEYGYNTKYEKDATGLPQQGFQRDNSVEAERVVSREQAKALYPNDERKQQDYINHIHDHGGLDKGRTIGWLPTCECGIQETEPCRVLDPFSGAGTTALVAERLGLDSINIDTSAEYIALSEARIVEDEQKHVDEQIKRLRREAKQEQRSK